MKNTIDKRILASIIAPSLLIFVMLSAFIVYALSQFVTVWAELELKSVSQINAADLAGRTDSVRISLLSAASVLDTLDAGDGRTRAEGIIKSMFENPYVHSVWIAYEPEAFDGRDAEYTADYPGAPSGRFMRSYAVENGQIVTAPDLDEKTLDDPGISPWYVKPRDTSSFYADVCKDGSNPYDYESGDHSVSTMTFSAPIHRHGKVIGCVGANISFDATTLGVGQASRAAIAIFYPDGRVFFTQDSALANDSVDTLGFTEVTEIKAAFSEGRSLFLPNQRNGLLSAKAFTYFQPVTVSGGDNLYLYTAIPRSSVLSGLEPVFMLITGIIAATILLMLVIIVNMKRKISNPLKALILAADAISQGDLETEIPSFPELKDEISGLSRSLHQMVEQFRIYILRLEQTQDEKTIYARIDELMAGGASEAMGGLLALLCDHFGADQARVVRLSDGSARVFSRHDDKSGDIGTVFAYDFPHHAQIMPMLVGKKLLLLNTYIMSEKGMDFLDKETRFACILPLREDHRALGYVILESRSEKNPFGARAEPILCSAAEAISDLIRNDEKGMEIPEPLPVEPARTNGTTGAVSAPYDVEGLDCAAAIQTMGGMAVLYEQALKLLTSLLPETLKKLDAYISSDMAAFAIEIHGLKGSLNNVGAYAMGIRASHVEQAAKSGNDTLCRERYAPFKGALMEFYLRLVKAFEIESGKLPGNILELVAVLPDAEEAAAARDCLAALHLLRPMGGLTFDRKSDTLIGEILTALETSEAPEAEKALEAIRELREWLTNWEGA